MFWKPVFNWCWQFYQNSKYIVKCISSYLFLLENCLMFQVLSNLQNFIENKIIENVFHCKLVEYKYLESFCVLHFTQFWILDFRQHILLHLKHFWQLYKCIQEKEKKYGVSRWNIKIKFLKMSFFNSFPTDVLCRKR